MKIKTVIDNAVSAEKVSDLDKKVITEIVLYNEKMPKPELIFRIIVQASFNDRKIIRSLMQEELREQKLGLFLYRVK